MTKNAGVKIYSEAGEGTTVKIYMPRLIEDDEDVRANTTTMLRELGYGVIEAPDAMSALRMIEERSDIDLLFTDIGLPGGINGRQLADKARLQRPHLRVLFTSGDARNAIMHQGRLDPGVELLSKPFTLDQLAAKIRQMLNNPAR